MNALPPLQLKLTSLDDEEPYAVLWAARHLARALNPAYPFTDLKQQQEDELVGVLVEFPVHCVSLLVRCTTSTELLKEWDTELRKTQHATRRPRVPPPPSRRSTS